MTEIKERGRSGKVTAVLPGLLTNCMKRQPCCRKGKSAGTFNLLMNTFMTFSPGRSLMGEMLCPVKGKNVYPVMDKVMRS